MTATGLALVLTSGSGSMVTLVGLALRMLVPIVWKYFNSEEEACTPEGEKWHMD
ncbi:hypothetical protein EJ06DRAFT_531188 [Trichodelitschia bisporula]|uniref:Uncharacterized protein n=1 Tax=Trichodelitschia bisporula TaxID=703511 RepID=A0A6G1HV19_9PEZI|nr:hypothetical protein EJ06DRAFT_531188 [Trichodelitschia bisporula]